MSRQGTARRRLTAATETLTRLNKPVTDPRLALELGSDPIMLDLVRKKISEQLAGWPTSSEGGGGVSPWCWAHEQEVTRCRRDGSDCDGTPVGGTSDRTGEAAVTSGTDQAAADDLALNGLLAELHGITTQLDHLVTRYTTTTTSTGEKGCDLCAIVHDDHGRPGWSKVHIQSTSLGGALGVDKDGNPVRKSVCQFHARFVKRAGRLPNRAEVKQHLAGERVFIPKTAGVP